MNAPHANFVDYGGSTISQVSEADGYQLSDGSAYSGYIAVSYTHLDLDVCKVCMQTLQTWQKLRLGTERVRSRYGAGLVRLLSVPGQ